MQVKTIRKTIATKIADWISNVDNIDLRKKLERDVIVTGGCITSLFLNEEVNDFDVYIRSYDTLLNVVNYYCEKSGINNIIILEGKNKEDYCEELMHKYNVDSIKNIDNSYAVAIRTLHDNQIKIYLGNHNTGGAKINYTEEGPKYRVEFISPNAITLSDSIQIVIRFWGEPDVIHNNYDFVHATNYWTMDEGLVTNKLALTSILTKQLIYQGSLYPVTSIIRVKKFVGRKWRITAGEIFKMIYQASLLDLTNTDVLEEQLIGMDVAYFGLLIEAIRNIDDKSKLTANYLFSIIDRIFEQADLEKTDIDD